VSTKVNGENRETGAKVLKGAPKFLRRAEGGATVAGRQTSAGCARAENRDYLAGRVCGRSWADLLCTLLLCVLRVSQHPLVHLEGWMISGQVFC
jgi:hypothetical protein